MAASRPIVYKVSRRHRRYLTLFGGDYMKKNEICKQILQAIITYLHNSDCLMAHKAPNRFVRKRKLSLSQVVQYLFYTSKASMFQNLASIHLDMPSISFPKITKQALSKARQGISPSLFSDLFNLSVDIFYKRFNNRKVWNGYHIFAIDGSRLELPNSKSNFALFGDMFCCSSVRDSSRRFTQALGSIVYDVLDDYIIHASINPYLASERTAALDHLKTLEALNIYKNSIVIFDRGYYSSELFRYCAENGHLCVMRLKERMHLARSCNGDALSVLPGSAGSADIKIRVIAVSLADGSKEFLATNLFDPSISADMFRGLYFLRWPVESKYMELKECLQLESFNGATAISIMQEFFLNMLLSNLVSLIKGQVDESIDSRANPKNKYRYQANRAFIIGQLKKVLPRILNKVGNLALLDTVIDYAYKCRSQIQPGRSNKRRIQNSVRRTHFNNRKVAF